MTPHESFERDGFLVCEGMFSPAETDRMRDAVECLLAGDPPLPPHEVVPEPGADPPRLRNAFRMHLYAPYFRDLAAHPALTTVVAGLLGRPLRLYSSQLFLKPARVGSEVPWHQDLPYWAFAPAELVSAWIAIDDTHLGNGCVRFLRGSHRLGVLPHEASGVAGNSLRLAGEACPADLAEVAIEVPRGSCVIHHCLTVHRSEPNASPHPRRGLIYVYMSPAVRVTDASRLRGGTDFPVVAGA
ncbi:MAG: phytanoyl-CoA dioxygenase family protein [Bryobacterales bacterium]|nr:phytanoyl-CoA dioxygenase family protein [Bryobacterales bacterium]